MREDTENMPRIPQTNVSRVTGIVKMRGNRRKEAEGQVRRADTAASLMSES